MVDYEYHKPTQVMLGIPEMWCQCQSPQYLWVFIQIYSILKQGSSRVLASKAGRYPNSSDIWYAVMMTCIGLSMYWKNGRHTPKGLYADELRCGVKFVTWWVSRNAPGQAADEHQTTEPGPSDSWDCWGFVQHSDRAPGSLLSQVWFRASRMSNSLEDRRGRVATYWRSE